MGVQPALPPGVHKLKLIKSLLKALQSLPLFALPVFPPKESILATLISRPVALLKSLIFELIFSLLNSLLITWLFDIVSELRVGICIYIIYSLFVIILLVILLLYIGIWSINSKIHSKITENNDVKIVDFSEDRGHFTGNLTGQITSNIEITLKINSKIKENSNGNNKDFNDFTSKNSGNFNDDIKIKRNSNENDYDFNNFRNLFNVIFENDNVKNNKIIDFLSDFNNIKDWVFNNNSDINVNVFTGIGNNINVYNKLMNLKMNKRCKNKNDNFRYYNSDKNIKGF